MQYALLVYETETDFAARDDVERKTAYRAAHLDFLNSIKGAGIAIQSVVGGAGLKPPHTATIVRKRGGSRLVVDGPYSDIKEQLGGIYLIDVADLDAALSWAERCPTASTGAVEVRPVNVD
ncbi:YciI family protein [Candidatus Viadribacter manganicus]|uniref:YCII-related domain-containing protein n=1 Tax=Candidatus Viadribacter manganicus TaxID=1759059 RepID=A0A1B1AK27_9PROT|nr:YciI family protein [Candidatus Viadribacter manganicus]ANP46870.1 hypothetical protein ATE48_13565 [Candidatus Viadribacter manganicus]